MTSKIIKYDNFRAEEPLRASYHFTPNPILARGFLYRQRQPIQPTPNVD